MTEQIFNTVIAWLESYWGYAITEERKAMIWLEFKDAADDVFMDASHIQCRRGRGFPSPEEMGRCVSEAREARWAQEKKVETDNRRPLSKPKGNSPMVRELLPVLYLRLNRQISKKEMADRILELERKYPGKGLEKAATQLMM